MTVDDPSRDESELARERLVVRVPASLYELVPAMRDRTSAPKTLLLLERTASKPGYLRPVLKLLCDERLNVPETVLPRLDRIVGRLSAIKPAPTPAAIRALTVIDRDRKTLGLEPLSGTKRATVIHLFDARLVDPDGYTSFCWNCLTTVDEAINDRCPDCSWLVCFCGACKAPAYGTCRRERPLVRA